MKPVFEAALDRKVAAMPGLLLAGVLVSFLVLASCGGGVTQEELDAVKENVADLQEKFEDAEAQLAQAGTEAADLRMKVDGAEARQALMEALLAWNRKDSEVFQSNFSERGIADTVMSLPESIGNPPIGLRRIMEPEVMRDVATVHVMFGLGTQRNSLRYSLVNTDQGWKIDAEERLSPKIKEGTPTVDIQIADCSLQPSSIALPSSKAALILENVGDAARHLALAQIRDDLVLSGLTDGKLTTADVIEIVAHVYNLGPGEKANLAFTAPLNSGHYALACLGLPDGARTVVADLTIP